MNYRFLYIFADIFLNTILCSLDFFVFDIKSLLMHPLDVVNNPA